MISRLTYQAGDEEGAALLPGLPVPPREGPFALPRAIAQVMEYTGYPAAYARLLAVSGEAFRVLAPCPLAARTTEAQQRERLLEGLVRLGFREAAVMESLGRGAVGAIREETSSGRPVVLQGWRPYPRGLSLIAGIGPGGLLCGYTPEAVAGEPYLAAPPAGDFLLTLGPLETPAEDLFSAGCLAARAQWERARPGCADLYRAWVGLVAGESVTPSFAAELAGCLAALVEVRSAAQDFLRQVAPSLAPVATAWVRRAGGDYGLMVERLEPLAERLAARETAVAWREEEQAEVRAALEEIAELDAEAVNCLRWAPEAEYPPRSG